MIIIGFIDKNSWLGKLYKNKKESIFYQQPKFYSVNNIRRMLNLLSFTYFSAHQTIFRNLNKIHAIEPIKEGYVEWGFVVFKAKKSKMLTKRVEKKVDNMLNFKEIKYAKKILGLPNKASLNEIKKIYHELAQKYHPDKQKDCDKNDCNRKMKELNKAYNILIEYCSNYKCSLDRKDFNKQFPSPYDKEWFFEHSSF